MKRISIVVSIVMICLLAISSSWAQVPGIINYQGRVTVVGVNFNGTGQFKFALVNGTGSTTYWSNDGSSGGQPTVAVSLTVTKGLYSVLLGDTTIPNMTVSIAPSVFNNSDVRLRVWFNDGVSGFQQLSPDQRIGAAGYALTAANVNSAGDIVGQRLNIGVGHTLSGFVSTIAGGLFNVVTNDQAACGGGFINVAGGQRSTVAGGADNWATTFYATVAGGADNRATGERSFVGGGTANQASGTQACVVAGQSNVASNTYAAVGGGEFNVAGGYFATVAGGYNNIASGTNSFVGGGGNDGVSFGGNMASGAGSTVGGGKNNVASGAGAFVGGGGCDGIHIQNVGNTASGIAAVIGGGTENIASGVFATVGGGDANKAQNFYSTVGGGENNTASGVSAAIAGGANNKASGAGSFVGGGGTYIGNNDGNSATGQVSTVGGGSLNRAYGDNSTVAGGYNNAADRINATVGGGNNNEASGAGSTVIGGAQNFAYGGSSTVGGGVGNEADGVLSFAGGYHARAAHDGSFVWADYNTPNFPSFAPNTFTVRCTGGAFFVTAIDGSGGATAGALMVHGDTNWESFCDRNAKENFRPINTRAILEKVTRMPMAEWNMKAQEPSIRHLGPMAQDFHAAFALNGTNDTHISVTDAEGVAFAAIQGLNQKLEEQVKDKETEIRELKTRLAEMEKQIQTVSYQLREMQAAPQPAANTRTNGGM